MRSLGILGGAALLAATFGVTPAHADAPGSSSNKARLFETTLHGAQETPANVTVATGTFKALVSKDDTSIDYVLTFSNLESDSVVAHIHVGEAAVAGGVSVFLCGGPTTPVCPTTSGTVKGTLAATDVVGPAAQGVSPGQLDRLLTAMRGGYSYVNVHSVNHPAGEIRGQVVPVRGRD
jgi:hypothetical protein